MRLGQLARKLELRPIEIVEFLATKNIHLEARTNSKLEAAHVTLAVNHFAPNMPVEDVADDEDTQTVEITSMGMSGEEDLSRGNAAQPLEPGAESHTSPPERIEVIKAPKVELTGLKVLGKIELPEPKKKQPESAEENVSETPKEFKQEKRNQQLKRPQRTAKNPIALQREQEALEAKRKREEEIKLQKERRTQNYLKKVKSHQPTKAAKLIHEQAEEMSAEELAEPPKTWWGRLMRWLTT